MDEWPQFENTPPCENTNELSNSQVNLNVLLTTNSTTINLNQVINCEKFSNVDKLFRIKALVLKFVKLLTRSRNNENPEKLLTHEEIEEAKNLWYMEIQKSILNDPAFEQTKKRLHVIFDTNGILRVGGRIDNAPLPFETKYPIYCPEVIV